MEQSKQMNVTDSWFALFFYLNSNKERETPWGRSGGGGVFILSFPTLSIHLSNFSSSKDWISNQNLRFEAIS